MPFAAQAHCRPAALMPPVPTPPLRQLSVLLGVWRATVIFAPRGDTAAAYSPIMIVGAWVQAFNAAGRIEALANNPPPEANVSLLRKNLAARPSPCGEPISVATSKLV